jgi:hypothetical protein
MAINFLYIGRDEATLHDKLKLSPLADQLPREMNYSSAFARASMPSLTAVSTLPGRPALNFSFTPEAFKPENLYRLNLTSVLLQYNISIPFAKTLVGPVLPADFDFDSPFAGIPLAPPDMAKIGVAVEKLGFTNPFKRPTPGAAGGAGPSSWPTIPGLPKLDYSKAFVPGGIILSEIEEQMDQWYRSMGLKNPAHKPLVSKRSMMQWFGGR